MGSYATYEINGTAYEADWFKCVLECDDFIEVFEVIIHTRYDGLAGVFSVHPKAMSLRVDLIPVEIIRDRPHSFSVPISTGGDHAYLFRTPGEAEDLTKIIKGELIDG